VLTGESRPEALLISLKLLSCVVSLDAHATPALCMSTKASINFDTHAAESTRSSPGEDSRPCEI
jgi:hypothetical protein